MPNKGNTIFIRFVVKKKDGQTDINSGSPASKKSTAEGVAKIPFAIKLENESITISESDRCEVMFVANIDDVSQQKNIGGRK